MSLFSNFWSRKRLFNYLFIFKSFGIFFLENMKKNQNKIKYFHFDQNFEKDAKKTMAVS